MVKDARIDVRCSRIQKEGLKAVAEKIGVSVSDLLLSCVQIVLKERLVAAVEFYYKMAEKE